MLPYAFFFCSVTCNFFKAQITIQLSDKNALQIFHNDVFKDLLLKKSLKLVKDHSCVYHVSGRQCNLSQPRCDSVNVLLSQLLPQKNSFPNFLKLTKRRLKRNQSMSNKFEIQLCYFCSSYVNSLRVENDSFSANT